MSDVNSNERHWMRVIPLIPPLFSPVYVLVLWSPDESPLQALVSAFCVFLLAFLILVFAVPACLSHVYDRPGDAVRWQRAALDASSPAFTTLAVFAAARLRVSPWAGVPAALSLSAVFVTLVLLYQRHVKRRTASRPSCPF